MDALTLKRIELLHPVVRKEVSEAYALANNFLLGKNVRLRFTHTLRTPEEQNILYRQGRTNLKDANGSNLKKVTNAKAWQSIHNYGLAFDFTLLLDTDNNGTFETVSWSTMKDFDGDKQADWMEVVNHFKKLGWEWGGDWKKFPDYPHLEKNYGLDWKALKSRYENGDTFTEIIEGKTYKWINL
jgi:peptidoglycan L-alanyl-D-glutamate endopeptidase CwlK